VELRLERINSHVELVVTDSGVGMGAEFLPYVFDRFSQADASSSRVSGGLGLGLAIVRHLVELHGGTVGVNSQGIGKGSTFTVRLPLRPILAVRGDAEPSERPTGMGGDYRSLDDVPSLRGARVLVVDDEPDTRELLRDLLESVGATVREARSANEAIEQMKTWRPAVLVSDIGMPEEDGYSLIRRVREWEKESGTWTPAVALTAYARSEDRMRALSAGYQVHASKPIDAMEFVLTVAGVIQPPSS